VSRPAGAHLSSRRGGGTPSASERSVDDPVALRVVAASIPSRSACIRCALVPWVKLLRLTAARAVSVSSPIALAALHAFLEVAGLDQVAVLAAQTPA
jgi:hypothetical protein